MVKILILFLVIIVIRLYLQALGGPTEPTIDDDPEARDRRRKRFEDLERATWSGSDVGPVEDDD